MPDSHAPNSPASELSAPTTRDGSAAAGGAGQAASNDDSNIDELRQEIDYLDAEILRMVKRRAEVSRTIGEARMAEGGPRIVYNREMDVLARYRELGPDGRELAMILLRLGRGRLGHL